MLYGYKEKQLNIYIQLFFFFVLDVTINVTFVAPVRKVSPYKLIGLFVYYMFKRRQMFRNRKEGRYIRYQPSRKLRSFLVIAQFITICNRWAFHHRHKLAR